MALGGSTEGGVGSASGDVGGGGGEHGRDYIDPVSGEGLTRAELERQIREQLLREQQSLAAEVGQVDEQWAAANPSEASAEITRQQWQQFQERFRPMEDELIADISDMSSIGRDADRASTQVRDQFARARGTQQRNMRRAGISQDARQAGMSNRRSALAEALGRTNAENQTRRTSFDDKVNRLGDMIGTGRGLRTNAAGSLSQAAGMQTGRDAHNSAVSQQNRQQAMATMVSIAAMAM
ncbi:MAG: hypothetical protein ACPGVG_00465 [Mycobacterium sp.]